MCCKKVKSKSQRETRRVMEALQMFQRRGLENVSSQKKSGAKPRDLKCPSDLSPKVYKKSRPKSVKKTTRAADQKAKKAAKGLRETSPKQGGRKGSASNLDLTYNKGRKDKEILGMGKETKSGHFVWGRKVLRRKG